MMLTVIVREILRKKYRIVMTAHKLCKIYINANFFVFSMGTAIFVNLLLLSVRTIPKQKLNRVHGYGEQVS